MVFLLKCLRNTLMHASVHTGSAPTEILATVNSV